MNHQMDFSGRNIWVTGAGQGIGRAVAEGFARLGGEVTGFDRAFPERDYGFTPYVLDVGDAQAVQQACRELLAEEGALDVFASVAGILRLALIEELTLADWDDSLQVNVSGPLPAARAVAALQASWPRCRGGGEQQRDPCAADADGRLQRLQGGAVQPDPHCRAGAGEPRRTLQPGLARFDRHRDATRHVAQRGCP